MGGRLVGWLAGWVSNWLVGWLVGWLLVGWVPTCLQHTCTLMTLTYLRVKCSRMVAGHVVGWLVGWLVGWQVETFILPVITAVSWLVGCMDGPQLGA